MKVVLGDHNSNPNPLLKFFLKSDNYQQSRGDILPIAHGGNNVRFHNNHNMGIGGSIACLSPEVSVGEAATGGDSVWLLLLTKVSKLI